MKNIIVVTGGAGFVGSNLIKFFLNKTKFKMISIDNYSSGKIKNHIKNNRVNYISGSTIDIQKILSSKKRKFTQFFTLENLQEFIKVFSKWKNV